uniref:Uncharacterized protein n=1 Tax=Ignisphaera aggregans TaxID=334771 RepID=A0A7J2U5E5_9CREN
MALGSTGTHGVWMMLVNPQRGATPANGITNIYKYRQVPLAGKRCLRPPHKAPYDLFHIVIYKWVYEDALDMLTFYSASILAIVVILHDALLLSALKACLHHNIARKAITNVL